LPAVYTEALDGRGKTCRWMTAGASGNRVLASRNIKQDGLAVASMARDEPSPLPGMHRDHNVNIASRANKTA